MFDLPLSFGLAKVLFHVLHPNLPTSDAFFPAPFWPVSAMSLLIFFPQVVLVLEPTDAWFLRVALSRRVLSDVPTEALQQISQTTLRPVLVPVPPFVLPGLAATR